MQPSLIDIGVNLSNKAFAQDRDQVVRRAVTAGVSSMILTGTSIQESEAVLKLAQKYPDYCYSTAGVHPHDAKTVKPEDINHLQALLKDGKVVAVGETGLDFNRDFSPRPVQVSVFESQIELAIDSGLPLFCHERDASDQFADIITSYRNQISQLVVHCFTADKKALYQYLDLDVHIGITGWVCDERRGTHLHPLLNDIPANRLMVETDSPYLLPRTLDNKPKNRRNEPAFLPEVIKVIAQHTNKEATTVAKETTAVARDFFRL